MKRRWLAGLVLVAGAVLGGCAGGYGAGYVEGPPPPRYGVMGVAPGPGYVWADGFWNLQGGRWGWSEGRWVRPPRRNASWVHPEWRREGNRWRYHRGYWR